MHGSFWIFDSLSKDMNRWEKGHGNNGSGFARNGNSFGKCPEQCTDWKREGKNEIVQFN